MNKMDLLSENEISDLTSEILNLILISAKNKEGIDALKNQLMRLVNTGALRNNETIVTNTRHYDSLLKALEEDRKSTRLNSSHVRISYAVFCLKKKNRSSTTDMLA